MNPHNFYIHVPFCASKCNYCAFYSHCPTEPDWDGYCAKILCEVDFWADKLGKIDIPTVFFGGGTPSLMPTDIFAKIMNAIRARFNVLPNAEITIESNPKTLDAKWLSEFAYAGVNRLSIGIQSLNDDDLKFLGRRHSVSDAIDLIQTATDMGLRVSADFIYGLPGQTVSDVNKLCEQINKLPLTHCSMYELSIEPGTPFAKMNLDMPDNDTMASMYDTIDATLRLPRYEVSNYGTPCEHNQNIWDGEQYVGIGIAAAGRPLIDGVWYDQRGGEITMEPIDADTRAREIVMTGLRTMRGIKLTDDIKKIIDMDFVNNNPELFTTDGLRLATTKKGMLILDNLLIKLIA